MKAINKLKNYSWCLRSLLSSIYFNFHYLPLSQAMKLPILLYKPKFGSLKVITASGNAYGTLIQV